MRTSVPCFAIVFLLVLPCAAALSGQSPHRAADPASRSGWPVALRMDTSGTDGPFGIQQVGPHTHRLGGLAAGMTLGAVVMSLDEVLGSGCIGSGDYLRRCQAGFVGGVLVGGGLGALGGAFVRTDGPRGRTTRVLLASALGAVSAFVVSTVACSQEDTSNPTFLCGFDGMVETAPVLVGAAAGGTVGFVTGSRSANSRGIHLHAVPGRSRGLALRASVAWPQR